MSCFRSSINDGVSLQILYPDSKNRIFEGWRVSALLLMACMYNSKSGSAFTLFSWPSLAKKGQVSRCGHFEQTFLSLIEKLALKVFAELIVALLRSDEVF